MHDQRDGGYDRQGSRQERGRDERGGRQDDRDCSRHEERGGQERGSRGDRDQERGESRSGRRNDGPDTQFLQLEMSQVLYGEAQCITKQAFRELLVEAAKERWRERFGDKITGLAQLAVDELMQDMVSSLEIESRINDRSQARDRVKDRLRDIFGARGGERESGQEGRDTQEGGASSRDEEGGEGEDGESGGGPSAGHDEER